MLNNLSILVVSCDAYHDLWSGFFTLFDQYWPECPYPIYMQTNHREYKRENLNIIKVGKDIDWSSNLQFALDHIPTKYVLVLLEDFFLCQPVDTRKIEAAVSLMCSEKAGYCRLVPKPPPDVIFDKAFDISEASPEVNFACTNQVHANIDQKSVLDSSLETPAHVGSHGKPEEINLNFGRISKGQNYRISFQASIWDKDILRDLLKPGENAWNAEMEGSIRSNDLDCAFLSANKAAYSEWPMHYMNAVIKRKWTPEVVRFCYDNDISLDLSKRQVCNWYDQVRRKRFFRSSLAFMISVTRSILGEEVYSYFKSNRFLKKIIY